MRRFDHDHVIIMIVIEFVIFCRIAPSIGYDCARSGNYVLYTVMIVTVEVVNLGITNKSTSETM